MTVLEFEAWVSDHYAELGALAQQQCRAQRSTFNEELARDVLHRLIEQILEDVDQIEAFHPDTLMGWFNRALWRDAINGQRDESLHRRLDAHVAQSLEALGADAYADARKISQKRADFNRDTREMQRRQPIQPGASPLMEFAGPISGNVRWRYQQLRDDRLFAARAIRSQADSIWAAVKRQVHGIERGHSYTEFGQEVPK